MKKILTALIISCLATPLAYADTQTPTSKKNSIVRSQKKKTEALDQIVAIVNEEVVTQSELKHALSTIKVQAAQASAALPDDSTLEKQVLDTLINKKLQLELATQAGIKASDKDLDKAIKQIAQQNSVSVKELYKKIEQSGMSTKEYRKEIKEQLILQKVQQQEVINHIKVSEQDIKKFIKSRVWEKDVEKEYRLQDILIPLSENAKSEDIAEAKRYAASVISEFKKGKNFTQIAQAKPSNLSLTQDDLGFRKLQDMPSAFTNFITHMETKNDIAGPIQTGNGFHIIRLTDIHALNPNSAPPTKKQVQQIVLQRKFEKALTTWLSKLRSQAFIVTNPNQ